MKQWIGVDLDGTLAEYTTWRGENHIGQLIPKMMKRILLWLKAGKTVKIFTARASQPAQIPVVEAWLKENGLDGLEVTNIKDHGMIELWDDKAKRVEKNTGKVIKGMNSGLFARYSLQPKNIVDKTGKRTKVYINPNKDQKFKEQLKQFSLYRDNEHQLGDQDVTQRIKSRLLMDNWKHLSLFVHLSTNRAVDYKMLDRARTGKMLPSDVRSLEAISGHGFYKRDVLSMKDAHQFKCLIWYFDGYTDQKNKPQEDMAHVIQGEGKLKPESKMNSITVAEVGKKIAAGDEAVVSHIKEGVEKKGKMVVQDAVRHQMLHEVVSAPKGTERDKVRENIKKVESKINEVLR